jgi:hypothetical protein
VKIRDGVLDEVKRFGKERDAIFDRTKKIAESEIKRSLIVDDILSSPESTLKKLFASVGLRVVRQMMADAKKAGTDHAERLQSINDLGP